MKPIEISVQEVHAMQQAGQANCTLLDCREPNEAQTATIDGAMLVPMSQWNEMVPKLEKLKDQHLIVHCHHGGRSLQVAQWLRQNGFPEAQSMEGGIDVWSQSIDASVPRY